MSRLDDIEARIAALEAAAGNSLKERIQSLEDLLGLKPSHDDLRAPSGTQHCDRCGMDQNTAAGFSCPQAKCPLK